ncbi:MAG: hypothetical protein ACTSRS_02560 [Candidatus Helarchaeota archaeon]
MQNLNYFFGVCSAIASGVFNNLGTVLQKKAVNELEEGEGVGLDLVKKPLWLLGIIFQMVIGTLFFLISYGMFIPEWNVGPALVPGLMAAGLIILPIGSIKILREKLKHEEYVGIGLLIIAIMILGMSELNTSITLGLLEDIGFIIRVVLFTSILCGIALFCEVFQKIQGRHRGIFYSIESGCMFALTNFWVAPLTALIIIVFTGQFVSWFVLACVILILTNIIGVYKIQQAFQHGQAANLIPIQQMPIQVAPIFVFFTVFLGVPPHSYSMPFMIVAVLFIVISSFLLAKRQAQLEEIEKKNK